MMTIEAPKEQTVEISCFTWVNINRIAIGHTDGTIALWSIHPCQILLRHPVHLSPIMDIASAYPSHPFTVVTIPMGGLMTLTDLNRPNQEMSYNPNLSVCIQPNLLAWCEILRGYVMIWPSAFAGNSAIAFEHMKVFAQGRYIMTLDSQPTCLSVGKSHPCVLVGTTDGSLWAVNIMKKAYSHREASSKLRLFRHEYRAANPVANQDADQAEETPRGKCRILHGYLPERNTHPKATRPAQSKGGAKSSKKSKGKGKGKKKKAEGSEDEEDDLSDAMGEFNAEPEGEGPGVTAQPIVVHDAQTRITQVTWNPNVRFGWWAAAAMGSGLVRVMDLGIDPSPKAGASSSSDEASEDDEGDAKDESGEDVEMESDHDDDQMAGEEIGTTAPPQAPSAWISVNK